MDEIEFKRAYNNLRVLIGYVEKGDPLMATHTRNALLTIAAMLDSLNQRINELAVDEDDE
jgi:hypothetical protein